MKFRKKPIIIDAVQWFPGSRHPYVIVAGPDAPYIDTFEGKMKVSPGDWIIMGVEGEMYPCKDSVFQATYERVEE